MKTFDRYLLRTLLTTILITLFFLLGVDFLVRSSDESNAIGGRFTFGIMTITLLLQIPARIIEFMPAAILVGTLMGIGQLNSQNELTVVRTAGISRLRISRAAIGLALSLGIMLILLGETIAPALNAKSDLLYNQARGRSAALYQQGLWLTDSQGRITHIARLNADGSISGLRSYRQQNNGIAIDEADSAAYQNGSWQLKNPTSFTISPDSFTSQKAAPRWQTTATPETLSSLASSTDTDTISELYTLTRFLQANGISHQSQDLQLWQRILLPFSALTMVLLALPFAFSRQRSTGGLRLVIGILLGVSYYVSQGILSNLAILLNWPPLLGALLPILLLGIPPLIILSRG